MQGPVHIYTVFYLEFIYNKKKPHPEAYIDLTLRMTRKENEEVFMLAASVRNVARVSDSQLLKKINKYIFLGESAREEICFFFVNFSPVLAMPRSVLMSVDINVITVQKHLKLY